ncbi:Actin-like protein [Ophiocordyceps sinensis CO18]|uniref:Actin-like protein n=1 Tax=Ophiocordyceps sinensis (strain Co18 / CGMCC 3.14243) TaxID=911162 RepID=T5AAW4_OPHSC|nr:Actin-like protein [Ophiocordyceps sinensis CO18]
MIKSATWLLRCRHATARWSRPQRRGMADSRRPCTAPKPMLDIKHIRQNPELYEQTCAERNYKQQLGHAAKIVALHGRWQELQREGRALRDRSNLLRKLLANPATSSGDDPATSSGDEDLAEVRSMKREQVQDEARQLKARLSGIERGEADAVADMEALALEMPNLTDPETPRGAEPVLLRYINEPPRFAATATRRVLSFDECEDILCRLMWCRASAFKSSQRQSAQLDTVEEQDESEMETANPSGTADIPLRSSLPPSTLQVPFGKLADVCDETYFDLSASPCTFDDHELPVHLLVYHHLLQLPVDVRALCMSRLMITGGCSEILGIKERIFDEVTSIVDRRGWAPVSGKGVDQLRNNPKLRKESVARTSISSAATSESGGDDVDGTRSEPADEEDPIEAKIARNRRLPQQVQGQLRAMHSLGPWAGASLVCQLKMPAMASMDREQWLQHGANGASRPSDVDTKAQQRHMAGTGGLMRSSAGNHVNWTLGIWGSL